MRTSSRVFPGDQRGEHDVRIDDQLHSIVLGDRVFDRLAEFLCLGLGELTLAGDFLGYAELLELLAHRPACDLASVDLWVVVHLFFEVVRNTDCHVRHHAHLCAYLHARVIVVAARLRCCERRREAR